MKDFEIENEVNEKVNRILQELIKGPIDRILSYALKGEEDAVQLYTFLSEKINEPHVKMRFKQFVKSEEQHRETILNILKELSPDKKPQSVKDEPWFEISIRDKWEIKSVEDYLDILKIAIEGERLAEKTYTFIAQNIPYEKYREIFFSLAKDEKDHYDFVKNQYYFYKRARVADDMQDLLNRLLKE